MLEILTKRALESDALISCFQVPDKALVRWRSANFKGQKELLEMNSLRVQERPFSRFGSQFRGAL